MLWLFESYGYADKIYKDVAESNQLSDDYYKANVSIVNECIEKAGIRLAGELNKIFGQFPVTGKPVTHIGTPMSANIAKPIEIADAKSHLNE